MSKIDIKALYRLAEKERTARAEAAKVRAAKWKEESDASMLKANMRVAAPYLAEIPAGLEKAAKYGFDDYTVMKIGNKSTVMSRGRVIPAPNTVGRVVYDLMISELGLNPLVIRVQNCVGGRVWSEWCIVVPLREDYKYYL